MPLRPLGSMVRLVGFSIGWAAFRLNKNPTCKVKLERASFNVFHGEVYLMKEWEITFLDQNGVQSSLAYSAEERPSKEEAAQWIRAKLVPVMAQADLNDLQGRVESPTERVLKEQNSVIILGVEEKA